MIATAAPAQVRTRVGVVDVLRGLIMVVMALDHTRDFFTNFPGNPLDPDKTTFLLYISRWVTHLCAPVFVFLAGASIALQRQRKPERELTGFLLTRGLWLIFVELSLVHLAFNFHWQWNVQMLEVIWAIGAAMMAMAGLIHLGVRGCAIVGAILVLGHNALDSVTPAQFGSLGWFWSLLHVPGLLTGPPVKPPIVLLAYPVLPWIGVMALGYAFGSLLQKPRAWRVRFLLRAGVGMLAGFVLLRWANVYGDPVPWAARASLERTLFSFFNVQKYPPSLLFLLATLGIASLLMALMEIAEERAVLSRMRGVLEQYGRVPFFYFLIHFALIHLLALLTSAATGGNWRWWLAEFPNGGVLTGRPPGFGFDLPVVWAIWLLVVALCYPACKWYAGVKMRRRSRWLSYL